ncbi:MAG: hypothetical protein ACKVT1_11525 [Dehalococcoidia bacterium]
MPSTSTALKAREFLFLCEEQAMAALSADAPRPERKVMWTILQLHYGNPAVHFELQPQVSRSLVELGLHFEAAPEVNDAWAALIAERASDLLPVLGSDWELEAWTQSWRRLHRTYSFERLTRALADEVSADLARALELLGPIIQQSPLNALALAAPKPAARQHKPREWKRSARR